MIPFTENSRKWKQISYRKQTRGCREQEGTEEGGGGQVGGYKEDKESLGDGGCVHCLHCGAGFMSLNLDHTNLYYLNTYSLSFVNYTPIKLGF